MIDTNFLGQRPRANNTSSTTLSPISYPFTHDTTLSNIVTTAPRTHTELQCDILHPQALHSSISMSESSSTVNCNYVLTKQNTSFTSSASAVSSQILTQHITNSHASGYWTWEHAHDARWQSMFYEHLHTQSLIVTPLTAMEAKAYEAELSASLPVEGFFPHPTIAAKNLALTKLHARVHNPLPARLHGNSTLCVPTEHYATAAQSQTIGTFIGFYMGWIVNSRLPAAPLHTFRIKNTQGHCDISGWDSGTTASTRAKLFPLSHINEYIWEEDDLRNYNNLRSSTLGSIYSRKAIRKGEELTLGLGLYEYDWSHYKRTLLEQALTRVQLLCDLQAHTEYSAQIQLLRNNLDGLTHEQYQNMSELTGPLHILGQVVAGEYAPPMHGTVLIHNMALTSYLHQLSGVQEFVQSSTFRQAHHPNRRHHSYFQWADIVQRAKDDYKSHYFPDVTIRRSARIRDTANLDIRTPLFYELSSARIDNPSPTVYEPAILAMGRLPAPAHDALTTLFITKHCRGLEPLHINAVPAYAVETLGLPTHRYKNNPTIQMHDGSLHHPTCFVLMGDLLGEAAVVDIPYTICTWSAICNQDVHIAQNKTRIKLTDNDGHTLARIPSTQQDFTPIDTAWLTSIRIRRHPTPINLLQLRNLFTTTAPPHTHAPAAKYIPHTPTPTSIPLPASITTNDTLLATPEVPTPTPAMENDNDSVDTCASDDDSVDNLPEIDMISEFAILLPRHSDNHIRTAWCNIAGCDDIQKIERVMALMSTQRLDILCLTDARIISPSWGNALKAAAIQRLGVGTSIDIHVTSRGSEDDYIQVGGQIIIKGPRLNVSTSSFCDPSGCAAIAGIDIHVGDTDLRIISTYWPGSMGTINSSTNSLWDKLQTYLHKRNQQCTPLEYIQSYITRKIDEFTTATSSVCIIGGDFNATRSQSAPGAGVHDPIDEWANSNGLQHVFTSLDLPCKPTYYSGTSPKHEIDHILYTPSHICSPTHGFVLDDDAWAQETDHRPVVADFHIPGYRNKHVSRWKRRRRRAQVIDIPRNRPREIALFQAGMIKRHRETKHPDTMSTDELHRKLQRIHKDTYDVAKKICSSPRRKNGNWTPHMVALRCRQGALLSIARITRKMGHSPSHLQGRIRKACKRWTDTLHGLSQTALEAKEWETYLGKGPRYWTSLPPWEASAEVDAALRRTRNTLNGRKSTERRQRFMDTIERRKTLRSQGKHLSEIKALLGDTSAGSMLDVLEENGQRITDSHDIATHATTFFHEWHQRKPIQHGFHKTSADIKRLLTDEDYFHSEHAATGIPKHLLDKIWKSLNAPTDTLTTHSTFASTFRRLLATPPTLAEFRATLQNSKRQSSAGMSGVTYNLMSLWPTKVVEHTHDLLCSIWTHKSTPPFWKWRWLVPIPKKADNNTLANLRPISLIEASRKLWIGIYVDKIKGFWARTQILCPSQHAYLADKSTEGALLQFRNTMEEIEECKTDYFLSSWDIKRAFDRVPKNILTLSWTRLGIPPDVAEYMVGLDTHGTTVVRTPYTEHRFRKRGLATFDQHRRKRTPCFKAEVGTGQGDVSSPLNWIAFFDILLCALDMDKEDRPLLRAKGGLHRARDTGYADDLVSVMTTLQGLQNKADVVSAFAIIFGLDIAIAKLRACKVEWGQECPQKATADNLKVHTYGWLEEEAQLVPLLTQATRTTSEALKYLGVLFDFANDDSSSHSHISSMLQHKLNTLHSRGCNKELKLEAIVYSLYPKARYPAKLAGWRLRDYHSIDKIFSTAFRRILQLPRSFPQGLLYSPRAVGGIGLPQFSTQVHSDKLAMMHRGLLADHSTNTAMEGLLERGIRAGHELPSIHATKLRPTKAHPISDPDFCKGRSSQSIWVQSMLEWLQIGNLHVHKHGTISTGTATEPVMEFLARHGILAPHTNGARQLAESGIHTVTDLLVWNDNLQSNEWNMDIIRDTTLLRPLLRLPSLHFDTVPLTAGQCWATQNALFPKSDGYIWEYIGLTDGKTANIRIWKTAAPLLKGAEVRLDSPSCGGGTQTAVNIADLLTGPAYKVTLSGDISDRRGVKRTLLSIRAQRTPTHSSSGNSQLSHPLLRALIGDNVQELRGSDIFTDGSCTQHTSLTQHLLGHTATATSGAVVLKVKSDDMDYGTIIHATNGHLAGVHTAYGMELVAATIATTMRSILHTTPGPLMHIHSDSKASVHTAHSCTHRRVRKLASKRMGFLVHQLHRTRCDNISTIHHCYSHPEKRKRRELYTNIDIGNSHADKASSANQQSLQFPGYTRHTLSTTDLLKDLLQNGQWYIGDSQGTPRLEPAHEAIQDELHHQYLRTRDEYRENDTCKPRAPFWTTATCKMAARQFHSAHKRSYAQQTRITKMIYDHYYHGENRIKGVEDASRRTELGTCHLCSNMDSEQHYVLECSGPQGHTALDATRNQVSFDITAYIQTLPPGLARTMAEKYRDLALSPSFVTPQPQRVWKGLLSANQLRTLLDIPSLTPTSPNHPKAIKAIKFIQQILAKGLEKIRSQITALTYPSTTRIRNTATQPTAAQSRIINNRLTQRSIRSYLIPATAQLALPTDNTTSSIFRTLLNSGRTKATKPIFPRGSRTLPTISHPQGQAPDRHMRSSHGALPSTARTRSTTSGTLTHSHKGLTQYDSDTPEHNTSHDDHGHTKYINTAQSSNGFQRPPPLLRPSLSKGTLDGD